MAKPNGQHRPRGWLRHIGGLRRWIRWQGFRLRSGVMRISDSGGCVLAQRITLASVDIPHEAECGRWPSRRADGSLGGTWPAHHRPRLVRRSCIRSRWPPATWIVPWLWGGPPFPCRCTSATNAWPKLFRLATVLLPCGPGTESLYRLNQLRQLPAVPPRPHRALCQRSPTVDVRIRSHRRSLGRCHQ